MLVWKKGNIEKTVSVYVYYYNGAQRYKLQIHKGTDRRLYRALILLGSAPLSSEHLCVLGLHGENFLLAYILFCTL